MAADGPALLGAAVRAACLAKAPRRTIQAVAAAVAGVLVRPGLPVATPGPSGSKLPCETGTARECTTDPSDLLEALRASRRAQRKRKKQRRRNARASISEAVVAPTEDEDDPAADAGLAVAAEVTTNKGVQFASAVSPSAKHGVLPRHPHPDQLQASPPDEKTWTRLESKGWQRWTVQGSEAGSDGTHFSYMPPEAIGRDSESSASVLSRPASTADGGKHGKKGGSKNKNQDKKGGVITKRA